MKMERNTNTKIGAKKLFSLGMECNAKWSKKILDECLLTDEEMALGPEKWKETMEEFDNIKLGKNIF